MDAEREELPSLADALDELDAEPTAASSVTTRRAHARARTISIRRLSKTELRRGAELYPERDYEKPRTRGECANGPRPCPFVTCRYHLYVDVHPVRGSIKLNFPDLEVWEMTETCALDVADRGGVTLEELGEIINLTRERVRQVETAALARLDEALEREGVVVDALLDVNDPDSLSADAEAEARAEDLYDFETRFGEEHVP